MRATQTNPSRRSLSPELNTFIQLIKKVTARIGIRSGRFDLYDFLEAIYRVYVDWKRSKTAKRSARALATQISLVHRKGMSPIRVLIEARRSLMRISSKRAAGSARWSTFIPKT